MTSDREIVITRLFDAPRDLVFDTFTDPKHVPSWWGAKGLHYYGSRDGCEAGRDLETYNARARRSGP